MPVINHIHKYERAFLDREKKTIIFQCRLPDCTHFVRQMFILNKKSICWRCDKEFIIDQHAAKMRKPKCGCGTKREILRTPEISDTALDDILKDIING